MNNDDTLKILLVENRDEVYSRLAADLSRLGVRVCRAKGGTEATSRCARRRPHLLLISARLPDESGWLLTSKIRMTEPHLPIWIYAPWASPANVDMANFVAADELIDYEGDLWRLSHEIIDRLGVPSAEPVGVGCARCSIEEAAGAVA
jgi:CheY-like chemotaxis protein